MLHTLVVPLDGSDLAERALPYAVRLAQARAGRLILARVAVPVPPDGWDVEGPQLIEIARAQDYLASVADGLSTRNIPVETTTPHGTVANEILRIVQECGADGVVMTTHGRTGLEHLTHGSVAEVLLARSTVPVFLVGARAGGSAAARPFDPSAARVLVALDGSEFAEAAIAAAVDILGPAGELVLLRVVPSLDNAQYSDRPPVADYIDRHQQSLTSEAQSYLATMAGQIARNQPGVRVEVDVVVGDAAPGIVQGAVTHRADLVVMATHGRTGLGRAVLGSVAGAVLGASTVPMLLVHPRNHAATAADPTGAVPAPIVTL